MSIYVPFRRSVFCPRLSMLFVLGATLLLASCANVTPAPVSESTSTGNEAFTPFTQIMQQGDARANTVVTTVGYAYADDAGVRLVDTLSFSAGPTPQPLAPPQQQLWIGNPPPNQLVPLLRTAGTARVAPVRTRGTFAGPGQFGPQGNYQYKLNDPNFDLLVPQDVTFETLFASGTMYENRFVRIVGTLFVQGSSGLLVEKTDANGVPASGARQVKLSTPVRDTALLARLHQARDQNVHFGAVQVEGFWRDGALLPLALFPTS